jgi:uncharacterized protein (DUF3084 family)
MSSQDHLQSLTKQSISLRNHVKELERQRTELEAQLNAVRAESQTKDKCASSDSTLLMSC